MEPQIEMVQVVEVIVAWHDASQQHLVGEHDGLVIDRPFER